MKGLEPLPAAIREPGASPGTTRRLRMLAPLLVFVLGLGAWDLIVRLNEIPPYLLPGPWLVISTLVADWPILSDSLAVTLLTALEGFIAAAIGGIALALLFNQSKWLEYSLL